jgi:nitrous oxide reductase accessory protein NosL
MSAMKHRFIVLNLVVVLLSLSMAAFAQDDIEKHRSCAYCGMDRKAYGFSRMVIHYEDGATVGVCSLHCAVKELSANQGRTVKALLVADRNSRELIDAVKAVWVMGGAKRGVMTQQPKWAFATKPPAEAFIVEYGGTIVSWDEALAAAREEAAREQ